MVEFYHCTLKLYLPGFVLKILAKNTVKLLAEIPLVISVFSPINIENDNLHQLTAPTSSYINYTPQHGPVMTNPSIV